MIPVTELLSQTSADAPAGQLLRSFWQPVARADELTVDSPLLDLNTLGEDLVLSRDKHGSFRLAADGVEDLYPCQHRNGLVFAYMGRYEKTSEIPSLADMDCFVADEAYTFVSTGERPYPWYFGLQACLAEAYMLHGSGSHRLQQTHVDFRETNYGLRVTARKVLPGGRVDIRISNLVFPNMVASPVNEDLVRVVWHVPTDDRSHRWYALWYSFEQPLDKGSPNGRIREYAPGAEFPSSTIPSVTKCREILLNGLLNMLEMDCPPFFLDGIKRCGVRGPPTLQTTIAQHEWQQSWRRFELERRSKSRWSQFINAGQWSWI